MMDTVEEDIVEIECDVRSVQLLEEDSDFEDVVTSGSEEDYHPPQETPRKEKVPKLKVVKEKVVKEKVPKEKKEMKKIEYELLIGGYKKKGPKPKQTEAKKVYPCDLCTYTTPRPTDLRRHFKNIHAKPLKKKQMEDAKKRLEYRKRKEKEKAKKAEERAAQEIRYDENGKIIHETLNRGKKRGPKMRYNCDAKYPCNFCTYVSTRKFDLKRHVSSVHNKEKPFACDVCNYSTGLAETLKQHMLKVHNEMKFKCIDCNYACLNQTEYTKHLMENHNYAPHTCSLCPFAGSNYHDLKRHVMTEHQNDKPFKCVTCNYQTVHRGSLVKHINYFHVKETIRCDECNFVTNDGKMALIEHKKATHPSKSKLLKTMRQKKREEKEGMSSQTGSENGENSQKDYVVIESLAEDIQPSSEFLYCEFCTFTTVSSKELNVHLVDIHHRESRYECECSFTTVKKFCFKEHMKFKHGTRDEDLEQVAIDHMKLIGDGYLHYGNRKAHVGNKVVPFPMCQRKIDVIRRNIRKVCTPKHCSIVKSKKKEETTTPIKSPKKKPSPKKADVLAANEVPTVQPTTQQYTNVISEKGNTYVLNSTVTNYSTHPITDSGNYALHSSHSNDSTANSVSSDYILPNTGGKSIYNPPTGKMYSMNKTSSVGKNIYNHNQPVRNNSVINTNKNVNQCVTGFNPNMGSYPQQKDDSGTSNMMGTNWLPSGIYSSCPTPNLNYSMNQMVIPMDKGMNYLSHITGIYPQNMNYFANAAANAAAANASSSSNQNTSTTNFLSQATAVLNSTDKYIMLNNQQQSYQMNSNDKMTQ